MMEKEKIIIDFFNQILELYEFEIYIEQKQNNEKVFKLNDLQGENLGNIEGDEFKTLADVIDRLDVYHNDYIYRSLEERAWEGNEIIEKDDFDFTVKRYLKSDKAADILFEISPEKYQKIVAITKDYDIKDIVKLLDDFEGIYRNVCQKYIKTMSKEMLINEQNKILHFFIADEFIKLKEKGLINSLNYKKYLDENFQVHNYDTYQEFFDEVIRDEIIYDIIDLGLFDDDKNWNFYISFEELKVIGLGDKVKTYYPMLEKYIVTDGIENFYDNFTLEELENFEKTLYLYFETNDIEFEEGNLELYSKSNSDFNYNIIGVAEGNLKYEDFLQDYIEQIPTPYDLSLNVVADYFRENKIEDLMNYGSDKDEGLCHLSSMYEELMDKLNIEYTSIYTEDGMSDGKYLTTIKFRNSTKIEIDTSAWNGIGAVTENLESIYEKYINKSVKVIQNENKKEKEQEYDYE